MKQIRYKENMVGLWAKLRCNGFGAKQARSVEEISGGTQTQLRGNGSGVKRTKSITKKVCAILRLKCAVTNLAQNEPHPLQRKLQPFQAKVLCNGFGTKPAMPVATKKIKAICELKDTVMCWVQNEPNPFERTCGRLADQNTL